MKDKTGIALGALVIVLVLISLAAYLRGPATIELGEIGIVAVLAVLVGFAAYVIWDRARNVSKGLPAKDERLTNVNYKAGYYGFIAAIWSAVFVPMIYDGLLGQELEGTLVTATVVIVSGLVFAISYLYLARKGR